MLTALHLRDFVLVDRLELDFGDGFHVITGETGAGKSILVDAIGLALGDRADAGVIRADCERAEIAVVFDLTGNPAAREFLREHDLLGDDNECWLRRVITREAKSRAYINQRPVALALLGEFGELLVDIHGQHAHQSLLRPDPQRLLLDAYAGHAELLAATRDAHGAWRAAEAALEALRGRAGDREARLAQLRHDVAELEALAPGPGELAELEAEHARLAHAGRLIEGGQAALQWLEDDDNASAQRLLAQSTRTLEALATIDPALAPTLELLQSTAISLGEATHALRHYVDGLELDPARLAEVDQRLGAMHRLARKHRADTAALPEFAARLHDELQELEQLETRLAELERQCRHAEAGYRQAATALGASRRAAAARLSTAVSANMQTLAMPGGRLEITVADAERPAVHGLDRVEIVVAAGAGQPMLPLARVASGGELSRISLALQVATADVASVATLIFDEVDAGIGGGVAEVVGARLRELGSRHQVLCVTHLPQVAAQAHHHYTVSKQTQNGVATTTVRPLHDKERVGEIARMLGGVKVTARAREHAQEMLSRASG